MIAEIIPGAYDPLGRKVLRPDLRHKGVRPTFPMGRYVSQSLTVKCESTTDIRKFLSGCRYVSDKEQFDRDDYWQPPEHFEQTKKGDCDDFSLWTWRQFLALGYDARFVWGRHGRYGIGHAWVGFSKDGRHFLAEPTLSGVGDKLPQLTTLGYHPKMSVAWDGTHISFYSHEDRRYDPRFAQLIRLVLEWLAFWGWFWLKTFPRLPLVFLHRATKRLAKKHNTAHSYQKTRLHSQPGQ